MDGDFGNDAITTMGVLGALTKEYASDEQAFLGFLASALRSALGPSVTITEKGGFLSKKQVTGISVIFGEDRFTLEGNGSGPLQAKVTHVVRGIALKTESIDVRSWLAIVSESVENSVAQHDQAR